MKAEYFNHAAVQPEQVSINLLSQGIRISGLKGKNSELFVFANQFVSFQFIEINSVLIKFEYENEIHALSIEDQDLKNRLKQLYPEFVKDTLVSKLLNSGKTGLVVISCIILLFIGLAYFYLVPQTGIWASKILPLETEVEIGKKMADQLEQSVKINQNKSKILQAFANEMQLDNRVKLHFKVIDDATINAFAMPGGYIYFYSGIIDKIQSPDQLAALIGHESTHVNERHSVKTLFGSLASYAVISLFFGDVSGLAAVLLENANSIQNLAYSRSFETEADEKGFAIVVKNGFNPNGMTELFEILKKNENSNQPISFLSSHPLTDERINHVQSLISKGYTPTPFNQNFNSYFTALKNQ